MTYDDYLVRNLLFMNIILAVVAGAAAWGHAKHLSRGWISGILGAILVVPIGIGLSAVNVAAFLMRWGGSRAFQPLAANLSDGIAFYLVSGIEFGLIGIGAAIAIYGVARYRFRANSRT